MDEFAQRGVPPSVTVIDMDVRDLKCQAAGVSGWTGYTWNMELFPNSLEFSKSLHRRGLKFTLNDHPADGLHSFEDQYDVMSDALQYDRASKDPKTFNITIVLFAMPLTTFYTEM
jgi:alpha-glucosidase (family GH31 glycosyl hydrolase)